MAIMKIRNIGSKGVIKDLPAFELPPEAWSDSNNVRFIANRIEKIGGYMPVLMDGMPAEPPLAVLSINNSQDQIYATSKGIYRINGRNHTNISRQYTDAEGHLQTVEYEARPDSTWYYTTLSNAIVMNTPNEVPQGLVPYKAVFENLPGWGWPSKDKRPPADISDPIPPSIWRAGRIRSYKNYLIALDMTEGNISLPQRVRWSNVAYVNELPPDWIEDDEARDGGFNDLTDANGRIVDGVPLRNSFVIYTDKETYLMEYVGGIMIFQFNKLFSDSGVLAPECAVEFEQKHFVITKDDIFVHNGSSKTPVASGRVKQYLIDEISSVNPLATKVFAYTPQKEIWITYVGPGQSAGTPNTPGFDTTREWACNKCAVWNWEWDTWYFMDIPENFDVNMAPPPDLTTPEWEDFSVPVEDEWDAPKWENYQWSELGKDFINRIPYVAGKSKALYTVDVGDEHVDWIEVKDAEGNVTGHKERTRPVVAEIVRTHLDMDEMVEQTRLHKFIRTITPQFRGQGKIHCYIGGSYNASEEPSWDNYQIYDITTDLKVDAFSNNRYPAIKYMDYGRGEWSIQGYDVDFVVEGIR